MRRPEDRRCNDVASWLPDVDRLRCAFSDITLVLMTSAMKMLLVFTVPWTPVRGSHFSTGVVMRADLLFRGCIGALRANLRHSSCIVGKCESGHGKDQDE